MSSLIWNGTVQHSLRRLNTSPLHSLRSSGHASSLDTRSFRNSAPSPSLPRTSGSSFLKSSHRLHGGVRAGKISPPLNGSDCYGTNRLCSIIAKYRITPLYGVGCWQATGVTKEISTRTTSRLATGSGPSNIIRARGFNVPAGNSSRNRCGGASCTALPTCCQTAPTLTSSAMRIGAVLTSFRN